VLFSILQGKCRTLNFTMIAYVCHFSRWKRYTIYKIEWITVRYRLPRFCGGSFSNISHILVRDTNFSTELPAICLMLTMSLWRKQSFQFLNF